jgi:hypothetical protein
MVKQRGLGGFPHERLLKGSANIKQLALAFAQGKVAEG